MDAQDNCLKLSADLWNEFLLIPDNEKHPDDTNDFRYHLHALQNILYTQKYKKELPVVVTFTADKPAVAVFNNRKNRRNVK